MTVEHMTLSGHAGAFPLATGAHQRLLRYLTAAREAVASEPDGDETARDLETAIGDRMRHELDTGADHIDVVTMTRILDEAGPVRGARDAAERPFWCRIDEGKWFGGLCLGIAAKGQFSTDWVRTIAFFGLLVTGGVLGVAYLVALLVVPRVQSVDEYRRRTGVAPASR